MSFTLGRKHFSGIEKFMKVSMKVSRSNESWDAVAFSGFLDEKAFR
jgi:hypothetical protein